MEDQLGLPLDPVVDHVAPLDMAAVGRRLRQRARRRAVLQGGALCAVLVTVAVAVPWGALDREPVQLAGGAAPAPAAPAPIPSAPASIPPAPAAPAPSPSDALRPATDDLPTSLPSGYLRCAGPTDVGGIRRTTFCAQGEPDLVLDQGPHWALPEVGDPIDVARRTGYVQRTVERTTVTVSDADRDDDTHHALAVADPTHPVEEMRQVLASIPAIRDAAVPR